MTGSTSPGQASLPTANSTKSFWHTEPSKVLIGYRTTDALPTQADVVIVGSGISGSSAARFCLGDERGKELNIVMLEAREACWGATGRNGGHCQPMVYNNPPDIAGFEIRNFEAVKDLITDNDISCDWISLEVAHAYMDEDMFNHSLENYQHFASLNPELKKIAQVVTKKSKDRSWESIRVPNAKGAFVQKHAASVWPYKIVAWILEDLLSRNKPNYHPQFNLQTNTPATNIQRLKDSSWTVHTTRGMIATKKVLLATNAYTSHLLPKFSDLIVPVRGEMSSLKPPSTMKPGSVNEPLDMSYSFIGHGQQNINQDDYLIQRPYSPSGTSGGELMFGGGRSYASQAGVGVSDDSSIDPPAAAYLRQQLPQIIDLKNNQEELQATYEWSGIMGFSRDDRPWVGEVKEELGLGGGKGLYVCGGYTGHGMPNAHLCAKAVVELLLGTGEGEVDLPDAYRLSRERLERARALDEVHVADAKGHCWGEPGVM